jgi:hypothetical protein
MPTEPMPKSPDASAKRNVLPETSSRVDDEDCLDWDFRVEVHSQRPSGTVRADVTYVGRAKPIPLVVSGRMRLG